MEAMIRFDKKKHDTRLERLMTHVPRLINGFNLCCAVLCCAVRGRLGGCVKLMCVCGKNRRRLGSTGMGEIYLGEIWRDKRRGGGEGRKEERGTR